MREALERGLADLGAEALVILAQSSQDPDLAPFVGPVALGESILFAPQGGSPHLLYFTAMEREEAARSGLGLIAPADLDFEALAQKLPTKESFLAELVVAGLGRLGLTGCRVALAGRAGAGTVAGLVLHLTQAGFTSVPGNRLMLAARKAKTEDQIAEVRRVSSAAATGLRSVADLLAAAVPRDGELWLAGERLTVGRLKRQLAHCFADFELSQPRGNIVAPAEEGAVPHNAGTPERVLRPNESLVVDVFPKGWMFTDVTRTFCVGDPPPELARAHAAVREALARAQERLAPAELRQNRRAHSLGDSVDAFFKNLGYPTQASDPGTERGFVHGLGHGVGFHLHEHPSFRKEAGSEGLLAPGDLLTLEPGLYDPAAGFGVRLEDLLYLRPEGPENLTPLPYDLDPRAWI